MGNSPFKQTKQILIIDIVFAIPNHGLEYKIYMVGLQFKNYHISFSTMIYIIRYVYMKTKRAPVYFINILKND